MKRKLVKQGTATMMISLPSKWVKENKLDKGSEIEMTEEGADIKISAVAKKQDGIRREIYNLSKFDPLINRALISLYIRGSDEIELVFSTNDELKKLKKHVLEELIGFEIINQTQTKILIKDVTGIENQDVSVLIKRIFFILNSMAEELSGTLKRKENASHIAEIDSSVNRFVHFCLRLLNKKGYSDYSNLKNIYSIVSSFEEIGDIYKKIAKEKIKINNNQIELIEESRKLLNIFEKLFFEFSRDGAKELSKQFELIKSKASSKEFVDLNILFIAERIIRMNNELFVMKFV